MDAPKSKDDVKCWDFADVVDDIKDSLESSKDQSLKELARNGFPKISSRVKERLKNIFQELQQGSGAVLLRFPPGWLENVGEDVCERAFLGLCAQLGRPVIQSTDLQEISARVETAKTPEVLAAKHTLRRGYRNAKDQFLHNDSSIPAARGEGICDILAMFCYRPSAKGGISKMASAVAIHEQLRGQPEVLKAAQQGFKYNAAMVEYHPDWRQPAMGTERPMVFQDRKGRPCVQYAKNMVETISAAYDDPAELEKVTLKLSGLEAVCSDPAVVQYWPLGAGEAYLVDNYRWLHARTDFEDDPKSPRLFFRLWLQVENFDSIA
ncbi:unnamed protein product [Cladocopium goreaui]|uniref:TauD/TfdA-like domain-containing protein n=1 Tax=Cladocopium goreaui TaxID=2562237 RepID=A0A9P1DDM9_9DINO|nr:unnamed protein product [Cladocopium goreaui]